MTPSTYLYIVIHVNTKPALNYYYFCILILFFVVIFKILFFNIVVSRCFAHDRCSSH